jgi:two-component system, cell cycle sensor histidine kinase and response regulator CckA
MTSDHSIERPAGGIARDFEQLLTAIIGHAETLGDYLSPGDPRAGEVAAIREAAERACRLTDRLFAVGRTAAPRPKVADLNAIVSGARYTIERIVGERIALELRLAAAARPVRVDDRTVQQLFYSLALSAREAMPGGGVLAIATTNVTISPGDARTRELDAGEYVELSVTGGRAPADASEPASLFARRRETLATRDCGPDLASVRGLIEQSGGHIEMTRGVSDAIGSRFAVLLPAAADGALHAVERRRRARGSATVLVAGDDPNVQALIMAVLRRRGYGVLGALDAGLALSLAGEHDRDIDLLITTTTMNGRIVADAFRGARSERHVLFVGVPEAGAEAIDGAGEFAGETVMRQPFTPDALARKVRGLLTAARVHLEMRILPK